MPVPSTGGDHGSGGSVEISGGVVTAVSGGEDAYAIGSGAGNGEWKSDFGFITISGGTVFLETSRPDRAIGSLPNAVASNQRSVHIRGGSVWAGRETVSPDPRSYDNTLVFPVDVDLGRPDSPVTASIPLVSGDSTVDYGMTDVRTDANGVVRFWLPEGNSIAEIDGRYYQISVGRERSWARPWNSALAVNGVFDLYCGTGTIAQIMAAAGAKKVSGIEIVAEAVDAARENATLNQLDNCTFIAGDVLKEVEKLEGRPDLIILDPPRDGIHPKALPKLLQFAPKQFIYVSCKPTSLVRDLPAFVEAGYRIEKIQACDMFPMTPHTETVVSMTKE